MTRAIAIKVMLIVLTITPLLFVVLLFSSAASYARAEDINYDEEPAEVQPKSGGSAGVKVSVRIAPTILIEGDKVKSNFPVDVARGQGTVTYISSK